MVAGEGAHDGTGTVERRLPPIAETAVLSMALIIIAGIYLASHLPQTPPLAPAVGLLVVSGALLIWNAVTLSRLRDFAWDTFRLVGRWTLLAYAIIAGLLEYVFVVDGVRGGTLVVISLSLLVYAVDIPTIIAFTVARYQPADSR
ncbi:MAG TPA: hypothetical protein VKX16_06190 [Chloroflexota bacterium]|nr:hypothetical protein [Chloroflexota bacterium]